MAHGPAHAPGADAHDTEWERPGLRFGHAASNQRMQTLSDFRAPRSPLSMVSPHRESAHSMAAMGEVPPHRRASATTTSTPPFSAPVQRRVAFSFASPNQLTPARQIANGADAKLSVAMIPAVSGLIPQPARTPRQSKAKTPSNSTRAARASSVSHVPSGCKRIPAAGLRCENVDPGGNGTPTTESPLMQAAFVAKRTNALGNSAVPRDSVEDILALDHLFFSSVPGSCSDALALQMRQSADATGILSAVSSVEAALFADNGGPAMSPHELARPGSDTSPSGTVGFGAPAFGAGGVLNDALDAPLGFDPLNLETSGQDDLLAALLGPAFGVSLDSAAPLHLASRSVPPEGSHKHTRPFDPLGLGSTAMDTGQPSHQRRVHCPQDFANDPLLSACEAHSEARSGRPASSKPTLQRKRKASLAESITAESPCDTLQSGMADSLSIASPDAVAGFGHAGVFDPLGITGPTTHSDALDMYSTKVLFSGADPFFGARAITSDTPRLARHARFQQPQPMLDASIQVTPRFARSVAERAVYSKGKACKERQYYKSFVSQLLASAPEDALGDDGDEDDEVFQLQLSSEETTQETLDEPSNIPASELFDLFDMEHFVDAADASPPVVIDYDEPARFDESCRQAIAASLAVHMQLLVQSFALSGEIRGADQVWLVVLKLMMQLDMHVAHIAKEHPDLGALLNFSGASAGMAMLLRILHQSPLRNTLVHSAGALANDSDLRLRASISTVPFALKSSAQSHKYGLSPAFWHILSIFHSHPADAAFVLVPTAAQTSAATPDPALLVDHCVVDGSRRQKPGLSLHISGRLDLPGAGASLLPWAPAAAAAGMRHDRFMACEDELLLMGLERFGMSNWEMVQSHYLPTRSPKQLAIRTKNLTARRAPMNPVKDFCMRVATAGPLSFAEQEVLVEAMRLYGTNWQHIQRRFLPNRPVPVLQRMWAQMQAQRQRRAAGSGPLSSSGTGTRATRFPSVNVL